MNTISRFSSLLILFFVAIFGSVRQIEALDSAETPQSEPKRIPPTCPSPEPRALLAGDSWAQFMWDDNSHNDIFDRFGHADKQMLSESRDSMPDPGYTGSEYAISGSEARNWVDTANYPFLANMQVALTANPSIDTVVLSIDGNDVLAGKSDGGWYKDMDLDVPGSEEALFQTIQTNTLTIVDAALSIRPTLQTLISSYDYPNFNTSAFTCGFYACDKREDLSRDPDNDLITDAEINGLIVLLEGRRIDWANANPRIAYDNSVGLMHHYYGDSTAQPGDLPKPGGPPPTYAPFPGGNPNKPTLRENFRPFPFGPFQLDADPIHLDYDGYQYKIAHQAETYFFPKYRGTPSATFASQGGMNDGWTDGSSVGSAEIRIGENATDERYFGLISIDTSDLPDGADITSASLYLQRNGGNGISPFELGNLGQPILAIKRGTFGDPAVEPTDATTVPTANDVGCFHGTAKDDFYAIRIDVIGNGLTAINKLGITQFRIAFPDIDSSADDPSVFFMDGDSSPLRGAERIIEREKTIDVRQPDGSYIQHTVNVRSIQHQGIAEVLNTTAPILDVIYTMPTAVTVQQTSITTLAASLSLICALLLGLGWQTRRVVKGSTR